MGRDPALQITVLSDHGDQRGPSFSVTADHLAFLGAPRDVHVACILPGHIRGNHFHVERKELILVVHDDQWSLHWDEGEGTSILTRTFSGAGAEALSISPGAAHALRNDGGSPMWIFAATDGPYDPERPDAYKRVVTGG
ncbi:MAG TPA: hypothetical protein VF715_07175 [Thermoleophilaceae bacterium]|jgi:dTDP-4-dehydrorhamnose 3,5-epimerase-like enzyme